MPAPPLSQNFDGGGGSNGTVISAANTTGGGQNAVSTVTDPNAIQKFSSAITPAHGGLCMSIVQTVTGASTRWDWTALGSITADVWFRVYQYIPVAPTGNHIFAGVRTSAAALSAEFYVDSARKIHVHLAAGSDITGQTGTVNVNIGSWFRFEFRVRSSTTVGQVEWRLFNTPDSTTADEAPTAATGQVLGANSDQIRWGHITNPLASFTSYFDDIAASTTTWLGPAVTAATTIPNIAMALAVT